MEYCYAASIRAVGFKFWVMDWWHVTCELYYVVMNTQVNSCNDGAGNEHNNFAPNIVSFIICIYIICAGSFCFQKSWCNRFLFGFGSCSLFLSPSCSTRLFCRFLSVSSVDSTFAFSLLSILPGLYILVVLNRFQKQLLLIFGQWLNNICFMVLYILVHAISGVWICHPLLVVGWGSSMWCLRSALLSVWVRSKVRFSHSFSVLFLYFSISLQLLVSSVYGVFCFVLLIYLQDFFFSFFLVNLIMGSSNLRWFFIKCCRFTCGSYCWSNTGNRECWGNSCFVSCTCCLDILQPYKVITFQTPF